MKNSLLVFCCCILFSCKKESSLSPYKEDPSIFQDQYGRQLILHGLNTGSKDPASDHWIQDTDVDKEDKQFGFNFVRYLMLWEGIEPQKGVFDEAYLDRIEQRVKWYTSRGMYVLLDMHQDLYSIKFGGDGAPEWAIQANGLPVSPNNPYGNLWFLKNLDPALVAAFQNFWKYSAYKELQDHYILAWKKVAKRFKDNPYVIGYDLMNEPYAGDLGMNVSGTFEKTQLKEFYDRLIPAIRSVDQNKYLFFEPTSLGVNSGLFSSLPKINDTRAIPKLAYAPHCYPLFIEAAPGPYGAAERQQLKEWQWERSKEIKKQNCPMIIGEVGIDPAQAGFDSYLHDVCNYMDSVQGGWTYWFNGLGGWSPLNNDGSEGPVLFALLRTYPKATAGKISSFRFDPVSKVFTMKFVSNAAITQPTEIFIPKHYYPNGFNLSVVGTSNYTQIFDEVHQLLKFNTTDNAKEITIEISPK